MQANIDLDELLKECEDNMQQLEADKPYCFAQYEKIRCHIDTCLQQEDYQGLLKLYDYFKEDANKPHLHLTSETIRIITLLKFLPMELELDQTPFISAATDFQSFMEQYTLTVFALRRLELTPCTEAVSEAIHYLNSIPLTIYAAQFMIEDEYFENYEKLYWSLYDNISSWSISDKIQWLTWLLKKHESDEVLLALASLYLEIQLFNKAVFYLHKISSPTEEVTNLINLLKEKC